MPKNMPYFFKPGAKKLQRNWQSLAFLFIISKKAICWQFATIPSCTLMFFLLLDEDMHDHWWIDDYYTHKMQYKTFHTSKLNTFSLYLFLSPPSSLIVAFFSNLNWIIWLK